LVTVEVISFHLSCQWHKWSKIFSGLHFISILFKIC